MACSTDNSCSWQNFSNLLDYIKLNLGASTNTFELTDEDIIDIIREHVLPVFSKYDPLIRYYRMTYAENLIQDSPTYIYQFKNFCYRIMKINNIIPTSSIEDLNMLYSQALRTNTQDVTEILMNMNFMHMSTIATAPHTWRFFAPDKIEITKTTDTITFSEDFIVDVAVVHPDPTTVNPDMYIYLRDLSLAEIMIAIGRIRSKYENFSSPYGEIQIASRSWVDEGTQLRRDTIESLKNLPPDNFLFFLS